MSPQKLPFIQWRDDYSVGNAVLDQQHRCIVQVINDLYDIVESGETAPEKDLQILLNYTRVHLEFEERILARSTFPDLEKHRQLHQGMKDWSNSLSISGATSDDFNLDILRFLRHWWLDHILTRDKEYAPFIGNHP